jgi:hypothetical protein
MNNKWRVTVEFAHGIRHTLDLSDEAYNDFDNWLMKYGNSSSIGWFELDDGSCYYFNRDYICSVIVEKLS